MAWRHWLLLGGSGLALACMHRREREVERWVRTPGTAGIGGPARLLLLHNRGSWHSHRSGSPDQPGKPQQPVGRASGRPVPALCCSTSVLAEPRPCHCAGLPPCVPQLACGAPQAPGETLLNRPGVAAAGEAGWLTFMQGHEQGQSDGAPGSGHGNHRGRCRAGLEQGAGSRERACCLRPAAKLSQADSSLPPCPGCL